jgi:hypothetical protein
MYLDKDRCDCQGEPKPVEVLEPAYLYGTDPYIFMQPLPSPGMMPGGVPVPRLPILRGIPIRGVLIFP